MELKDCEHETAEKYSRQLPMSRDISRLALLLAVCVLPLSQPGAVCAGAKAQGFVANGPNIILVMTDDQGYGDLGWTGNPILKTPHLDAFARQSVRFTDFHVSPTCAPTRAALMTGRHEFKNGVTHTINERERLTLKATTIAHVLKKAGYATGIFGKWHLGDEARYQPNQRGFDEVFIHGAGGIGQTYAGSCGDAPGNTYSNPAILHNGRFEKTSGYCTDVFFAQAIKWMDERRRRKAPFFAYIAPNAPHAPLDCPDEYFKRYEGKVPDNVAKFFGMIENIDDNFAALVKKLDEWGVANNALVIFMTDNGGTVGVKIHNAGMRGSKATPYQGGTRVPSLWRWPAAFRGGADCPALTAHIDIFPTLAEIAGVKLNRAIAKQVEGRSLLPLLRDPQAPWPDRFFVTHVGRWERGAAAAAKFEKCSIRDSRFTLVNNKELYDLKTDSGETINVIDQHPEAGARLRAAYDRWWEDVQPLLVNENVVGPKVNPFKALYWKQFGGGPDKELRRKMDPTLALRAAGVSTKTR
jgi:arylsulfatase A-like enzyme